MIRSMHTEAINHDPAITFCQTGSQLAGRPSIGSWVSYGLGSENEDLPAYVVLTSFGSGRPDDQPLYDRLWGSGFLPSKHQGVKFRNSGDAVLYLSNPPGDDRPHTPRARWIDWQHSINSISTTVGDPEIQTRIAQYEMAFRMQTSVPDLLDVSRRTETCARQLRSGCSSQPEVMPPTVCWPGDWPSAMCVSCSCSTWAGTITAVCRTPFEGSAGTPIRRRGMINDLKQRGLLKDTLIVWGGEFGRTIYSQGDLTADRLRPRPSSALLHHSDGRCRRQGRHDATGRPTTTATTSCEIRSMCTISTPRSCI